MNAVRSNSNTPSREDYLKAILSLSANGDSIRSSILADKLGVTRASVSNMLNVLKENGCVEKEKYSSLALTEYGYNLAVDIKNRYDIIKSFLVDVLEIDSETADFEACNIEHAISRETIEKLNGKMNKLSACSKEADEDIYKNIGEQRYA